LLFLESLENRALLSSTGSLGSLALVPPPDFGAPSVVHTGADLAVLSPVASSQVTVAADMSIASNQPSDVGASANTAIDQPVTDQATDASAVIDPASGQAAISETTNMDSPPADSGVAETGAVTPSDNPQPDGGQASDTPPADHGDGARSGAAADNGTVAALAQQSNLPAPDQVSDIAGITASPQDRGSNRKTPNGDGNGIPPEKNPDAAGNQSPSPSSDELYRAMAQVEGTRMLRALPVASDLSNLHLEASRGYQSAMALDISEETKDIGAKGSASGEEEADDMPRPADLQPVGDKGSTTGTVLEESAESNVAPQSSGLMAGAAVVDISTLADGVQQFFNQVHHLGRQFVIAQEETGLPTWIAAVAASVIGLDIARRQMRRSTPEADLASECQDLSWTYSLGTGDPLKAG
jgi:hypothetical protein